VLAVAAVLAGCAETQSGAGSRTARVARIGDGDSLDLANGKRVRLVQVDAPELGEGECYARESLRELERRAPPGRRVELERDPRLDDADRYGRLLRYVAVGSRIVNVELVRSGAATPYFFHGVEGRYARELLTAVTEARAGHRGMWGECQVSWRRDRPVATRPR
jgi:endonuclease YncB( thermonuclease family)